MKNLGSDRSYREERGEFLCDGNKLLKDAVASGADILAVLSALELPLPFELPAETKIYRADRALINSLSPLKNAQDTLFVCKICESRPPLHTAIRIPGSKSGRIAGILLDHMQDPGNVGAIIRTADAFGIDAVLLSDGCADPYNPKTLRASMGAIFRQRFAQMDASELFALKKDGARFIGATARVDCRDIREINLDGAVIAIGNEGRGLSDGVLALCEELMTIPIASVCESLNASAAAAIIMWEAARKE